MELQLASLPQQFFSLYNPLGCKYSAHSNCMASLLVFSQKHADKLHDNEKHTHENNTKIQFQLGNTNNYHVQ